MAYTKYKTKLWESDGTNDLSIGSLADIHYFNISTTSPGNDVTTTGAINGSIPAGSVISINTTQFDYCSLIFVFEPLSGTVAPTFVWQSSPLAVYAKGVGLASDDPDFNVSDPHDTDVTEAANPPLSNNLLHAHLYNSTSPPSDAVCTGKPSGTAAAAHFATSVWLASTGVNINSTTNIFQTLPIGTGRQLVNTRPDIRCIEEVRLGIFWTPNAGGAIATGPKVRGQIWFVGYDAPRGF